MTNNEIQFRLPTYVVNGTVHPEDYIDMMAQKMWNLFIIDYGVAEWSLVALAERALDINSEELNV